MRQRMPSDIEDAVMKPHRRPMPDEQTIAALRRKPYDKVAREAARRLEELLRGSTD